MIYSVHAEYSIAQIEFDFTVKVPKEILNDDKYQDEDVLIVLREETFKNIILKINNKSYINGSKTHETTDELDSLLNK